MSDIDEFEMKPLTTGLGFQKRSTQLKKEVERSGLSNQHLGQGLPTPPPDEDSQPLLTRGSQEMIKELHEALEPKANKIKLSEILPRDISDLPVRDVEINQDPKGDPLSEIDFEMPSKNLTENSNVRRGAHDGLVRPLTPISVSFSSMILDATIVFAFSLIFLVSLVAVTKVNLNSVVFSSQFDFATQLSLVVLYFAVYQMYMIVSRSFFGRSVGEWTFDLQLGDDAQIQSSLYPALVLWRSILNLLTGVILLPVLSFLFREDIASRFTGLQLFRRNI